MGKLIQSSFYDTDVSANNSSIDYGKLAIDAKPMASVYSAVQDYLDKLGIDKLVKTRRKHIQYIDPIMSNKLMVFLFEKYKNDSCVTKVDLFSAVLDVVDVPETDFYESLSNKIKQELKQALQDSIGFKMNFDIDKKEMKQLGMRQVEI